VTRKRIAVIDCDTLIYTSAIAAQQAYVNVRHIPSGKVVEFPNKSEFYGKTKAKDGGWLAERNAYRVSKGLSVFHPDEFEIEHCTRLIESDVSPETIACGRFKARIEWIRHQPWCKDIRICFATGTNYRYSIAKTWPYKADRAEKPLLYEVVRDYMLKKWKTKMILGQDIESDDLVGIELSSDWKQAKGNHNNLKCVGTFIDKDLKQFPCWWFNFDDSQATPVKIGELEACKNLAKQMLTGDSTDNIPGIRDIPKEYREAHSLGLHKGVGPKTAEALIGPLEDCQSVWEAVVQAYKATYGETPVEFITWQGNAETRTWYHHFNEQFQLLKMMEKEGQIPEAKDWLKNKGVDVGL
jgi:hypothetical protein